MKRFFRTLTLGLKMTSYFLRVTDDAPSDATTRSYFAAYSSGSETSVSNTRLTPRSDARFCRIFNSRMRAIPQNPCPPEVNLRPLKKTSISSQWRNACVMARCVSGSASLNPSIVLSENTTPQPNVASARFRSMTVISHEGLAFFARIAKYNPAGPPPKHATLMPPPAAWLPSIYPRFHGPALSLATFEVSRRHLPCRASSGAQPSTRHNFFRPAHAYLHNLSGVVGIPRFRPRARNHWRRPRK